MQVFFCIQPAATLSTFSVDPLDKTDFFFGGEKDAQ
jgi:hypothetical protein